MKQTLSMPVLIGVAAIVVVVVAFFFLRTVTATPHTPRPNPAMFGAPKKAPSTQ
jgi:hypothetical protein